MVKGFLKWVTLLTIALCTVLFPGGAALGEENEEKGAGSVILHGPQIPPEGIAYDEWQQLSYSTDLLYNLKSLWGLRPSSKKEEFEKHDYILDNPADATMEFVTVQVEPQGGEMRLRSGGYVKITVLVEFQASYHYSYDMFGSFFTNICDGISFSSNDCIPFDRYTGTTLLNFHKNTDEENLSQGQATDSGFVESRVTWQGRTFRILSRKDVRNISSSDRSVWEEGYRIHRTIPGHIQTEYTFIVPADYDGLAMCFFRRTPGKASIVLEEEQQEETEATHLYTDVMTGGDGTPRDKDNMIFVLLSELAAVAAK